MAQNTQKRGIDLGMAIAKNIIDLHGGGVSIKSKKDEGDQVILRIPVK
jgi:K+-sensing histidine kinase KdpD